MKYTQITCGQFLSSVEEINPSLNLSLLKKVLDFAMSGHKNQFRKSGEPYIIHPVQVAYILASLQMDSYTVAAGLLHDILEDTSISYTDLKNQFGEQIANLVDGVTKIRGYDYKSESNWETTQAENYRKLLLSVARDLRVIVVKLADRLHNMRTLQHMLPEKRVRIAQETLDIYAPLANRFGIAKIKWELEDLCLKYLHPEVYSKIADLVKQKKNDRENYLKEVIEPLQEYLKKKNIQTEISGRSKHFYSIYRKHLIRKIDYADLYDLAALRIIVDTIEQCYFVLGLVHEKYEPIGRFRDYIARPKPNGYQSLHTIVIGPKNRQVEIQIRTQKMHEIAEEGIAAHWRYKENQCSNSDAEDISMNQVSWIRNLLSKEKITNSADFIEQLKLNLYPEIIIVQTPQHDFIKLPKNSTPLDFAFAVHTELGFRTIGAKVNGKMVPLRSTLSSGDIIQILSTKKNNASLDWLDFLRTSRARQKVRSYFRKKELEDAISLGSEIFVKRFRKTRFKLKNTESMNELLQYFKLNDLSTFFAKIGKSEIEIIDLKSAINFLENGDSSLEEIIPEKEQSETKRKTTKGIKIEKIDNLMIHYAKCCNPIPGDEVIGYTTRGRGITIHKKNCSNQGFINLQKKEPERILQVEWDYEKEEEDQIQINMDIIGNRRSGFLLEILNKFAEMKIDLTDTDMKSREHISIGKFSFCIPSLAEMDKIRSELNQISGIMNITWHKK